MYAIRTCGLGSPHIRCAHAHWGAAYAIDGYPSQENLRRQSRCGLPIRHRLQTQEA